MSGRPHHLPAGMFSNYFLTQLTPNIPPTGRLKYFQPVWQRITQDPWVLQVIQGYQLELLSTPTQHLQLTFPRLTQVEQKVLDQEVQELLDKQAVHQISASDTAGFISSLFVVPKKDGGNRPVVNLKPLNQFLVYEHFKMEGIHMLRDLLRQGDYLVKIDLKDAYLTVPIWKGHQKYLRFLWKETLLEFACLPFGLATAPRVFTKLMKPVVAMLRQRGVRLIIYLDDMLIMAESTSLALHHAASALNLLESLGFVVNYHKSQLIPSQQIEFLGFLVDSVTLSLQLPGEKLRKIRKRCQQLLNVGETSIRELSKFLGLLTSSIQAVFPAPLHYRHLQRLKNLSLNTLQSYDAIIPLDSLAKEELVWWRDHLQAWNGKALFQKSVDLVIETDASRKGWGGLLRRSKYRGPMVFKRTETLHKFFRTPSRILCNQNFLQEQGSSTCQTADGQCVSSSLHQQNGGHPFPNSSQFGYRPLELVPRPQNTGVGRTPARSSELEGRQRISSDNRLQRLEIESSIFRNPCSEMGTFASRSLCLPTNFPVTTVCELETRSSCHCHRCFLNELGGHQRLCFSSICPHRTLFATGNDAECRPLSVSSSSMASTALVSNSSTLSSRQASVTSRHTRAFNERQSSTPFDQSATGWVGAISQRYQTSGISTETRDILLAAWRRNTSSAYSCAWNKWVSWCCQRQINPISASLTSVLEFLKDQFKGGKAYRTLNVYRSALSAVLPLVDSFRVGAHP